MKDIYFLGGNDLEMEETRVLLSEIGLADRIVDKRLAWGARAGAYEEEIRAALGRGETPVLIELQDDLPEDIDRSMLVVVDHHGDRAGVDRPSALRQIHERVGKRRGARWTRRRELVEANDIGHAALMRARGATAAEIRSIRDADRRAQGVSLEVEDESRRALAASQYRGPLLIVHTTAPTSSAITDLLLPEYGGLGSVDVVVVMPEKIAFYGRGSIVARLAETPHSWKGGALPDVGYWGMEIDASDTNIWVDRIAALVAAEHG